MKKLTLLAAIILTLQLFLPFTLNANAEESIERYNYLALGDSLAAGMDEKGGIGYGYADYLAILLEGEEAESEEKVDFNKGFAYPGYTTTDVLKDIQEDITKPVTSLTGISQKTISIHQAIKAADVITLSIGANDVLKNAKISETGQLSIDLAGVTKGIQDVAVNYEKIFTTIYELNPAVDIVVMGIYNPFPYIQDASIQTQLNTLVSTMNKSLQNVVENNAGIYSNVAELIASNFTTYLPNPQNIHLGAAGYEAVAEKILEDYIVAVLGNGFDDFEDDLANEVTNYFTDVAGHWGSEYINIAYMGGFMNGFEDGTFKPNANVTRVQALSVIARAFELPATKPAPFVDIKNYPVQTQNEIAAVYEAGLIKENGGYLNPNDNMTRAQFTLILARLSNSLEGEVYVPATKAPFTDIVKYDEETQNAITLLYDLQLVQGQTANEFDPAGSMTRAQLAKILVMALFAAKE